MQPYKIEPMTKNDLDDLVKLHDIYLNYGDGILPHYEVALDDPATIAFKATVDGKMVGFTVYTVGISLSGGHDDLCQKIVGMCDGKAYTGDALLVVKEWRHQGIDTALRRATRTAMLAAGGKYVLHELWVYPDGKEPAKHAMEDFGPYVDLGLFPMFYKDFDHYGYLCPICGAHCICSAHLFLSEI